MGWAINSRPESFIEDGKTVNCWQVDVMCRPTSDLLIIRGVAPTELEDDDAIVKRLKMIMEKGH